MIRYDLIHREDQGGCGGVAFSTKDDPQHMDLPPKEQTKCWSCGAELLSHHWRLRNFQSDGGNHD